MSAPIQTFEEWSKSSTETDSVNQLKSFAGYVRKEHFKNGTYNEEIESGIKQGLNKKLKEFGVMREDTPEEERQALIQRFETPDEDFDGDARFIYDKINRETGEDKLLNEDQESSLRRYVASKNLGLTEQADRYKAQVSEILSDPYVKATAKLDAVDRGVFPVVAVVNKEGNRILKQGPGFSAENVRGSIDDLIAKGAIATEDIPSVQRMLNQSVFGTSTNAELMRGSEFADDMFRYADKDENVAKTLEAVTARRNQEAVEADRGFFGDLWEGAKSATGGVAQALGDVVTTQIESVKGGVLRFDSEFLGDVMDKRAKRGSAELAQNALGRTDLVEMIANSPLGQKYSREEIERFSNDFIAQNNPPTYDPDKPESGIRVLSTGQPILSPAIVAREQELNKAIEASGLNPAQAEVARETAQRTLAAQAPEMVKTLLSRDTDALDAYTKAKKDGKADHEFIKEWVSNDENYDNFRNRVSDVAYSAVTGIGTLALAAPALFGNEQAAETLAKMGKGGEGYSRYAEMFGDKFGVGQEIARMLPQIATDVALAAVSGGTLAAGKAVAGRAAAGIAASVAKKEAMGVAARTTRNMLVGLSDEAAQSLAMASTKSEFTSKALRSVADNLGKVASSRGGFLDNLATVGPSSFLRSAGGTYGSIYGELPASMSHEEKHKTAFGTALAAGSFTAVLTAGMSTLGAGGVESLATQNLDDLTFNQLRKLYSTTRGMSSKVTDVALKRELREATSGAFKQFLGGTAREASGEAFEEGLDQAFQMVAEDAALNRNTPIAELGKNIWYAAGLGAVFGAGFNIPRQLAPAITKEGKETEATKIEAARYQLFGQVAEKLKGVNAPKTADAVAAVIAESNATKAATEEAVADAEAPAGPEVVDWDPSPDPDKAFLSDYEGTAAHFGDKSGMVRKDKNGQMVLEFFSPMSTGETSVVLGDPSAKAAGVIDRRFKMRVTKNNEGGIKAGSPVITRGGAKFALPHSSEGGKPEVIYNEKSGRVVALRVQGARQINGSMSMDVVVGVKDGVLDFAKYYGVDVSPKKAESVEPNAPAATATATTTTATPAADPASAARRKSVVRTLVRKGVDTKVANTVVDAILQGVGTTPNAELQEAALTLFKEMGGVIPEEITTRSENVEEYEISGMSREEAEATVAANKELNDKAKEEARAKNQAVADAPVKPKAKGSKARTTRAKAAAQGEVVAAADSDPEVEDMLDPNGYDFAALDREELDEAEQKLEKAEQRLEAMEQTQDVVTALGAVKEALDNARLEIAKLDGDEVEDQPGDFVDMPEDQQKAIVAALRKMPTGDIPLIRFKDKRGKVKTGVFQKAANVTVMVDIDGVAKRVHARDIDFSIFDGLLNDEVDEEIDTAALQEELDEELGQTSEFAGVELGATGADFTDSELDWLTDGEGDPDAENRKGFYAEVRKMYESRLKSFTKTILGVYPNKRQAILRNIKDGILGSSDMRSVSAPAFSLTQWFKDLSNAPDDVKIDSKPNKKKTKAAVDPTAPTAADVQARIDGILDTKVFDGNDRVVKFSKFAQNMTNYSSNLDDPRKRKAYQTHRAAYGVAADAVQTLLTNEVELLKQLQAEEGPLDVDLESVIGLGKLAEYDKELEAALERARLREESKKAPSKVNYNTPEMWPKFRTDEEKAVFDSLVEAGYPVTNFEGIFLNKGIDEAEVNSYMAGKRIYLKQEIEKRYPTTGVPEGDANYSRLKKSKTVRWTAPNGDRVYAPIVLDANGVAVFTNDPVLTQVQMEHGFEVRVPRAYQAKALRNPSIQVSKGYVSYVELPYDTNAKRNTKTALANLKGMTDSAVLAGKFKEVPPSVIRKLDSTSNKADDFFLKTQSKLESLARGEVQGVKPIYYRGELAYFASDVMQDSLGGYVAGVRLFSLADQVTNLVARSIDYTSRPKNPRYQIFKSEEDGEVYIKIKGEKEPTLLSNRRALSLVVSDMTDDQLRRIINPDSMKKFIAEDVSFLDAGAAVETVFPHLAEGNKQKGDSRGKAIVTNFGIYLLQKSLGTDPSMGEPDKVSPYANFVTPPDLKKIYLNIRERHRVAFEKNKADLPTDSLDEMMERSEREGSQLDTNLRSGFEDYMNKLDVVAARIGLMDADDFEESRAMTRESLTVAMDTDGVFKSLVVELLNQLDSTVPVSAESSSETILDALLYKVDYSGTVVGFTGNEGSKVLLMRDQIKKLSETPLGRKLAAHLYYIGWLPDRVANPGQTPTAAMAAAKAAGLPLVRGALPQATTVDVSDGSLDLENDYHNALVTITTSTEGAEVRRLIMKQNRRIQARSMVSNYLDLLVASRENVEEAKTESVALAETYQLSLTRYTDIASQNEAAAAELRSQKERFTKALATQDQKVLTEMKDFNPDAVEVMIADRLEVASIARDAAAFDEKMLENIEIPYTKDLSRRISQARKALEDLPKVEDIRSVITEMFQGRTVTPTPEVATGKPVPIPRVQQPVLFTSPALVERIAELNQQRTEALAEQRVAIEEMSSKGNSLASRIGNLQEEADATSKAIDEATTRKPKAKKKEITDLTAKRDGLLEQIAVLQSEYAPVQQRYDMAQRRVNEVVSSLRLAEAQKRKVTSTTPIRASLSDTAIQLQEARIRINERDAAAMGLNEGTETALRYIAANGAPHLKVMANVLLNNLDFVNSVRVAMVDIDSRVAGLYISEDLVLLNRLGHNGRGLADVLIHELTHALTVSALRNPDVAKRIESLRILAKRKLSAGGRDMDSVFYRHAFKDNEEFLSAVFTDKHIQDILRGVEVPNGRTWLARVWDVILKFFKIRDADNALDELIRFADMSAMTYGSRAVANRQWSENAAAESSLERTRVQLDNATMKLIEQMAGPNAEIFAAQVVPLTNEEYARHADLESRKDSLTPDELAEAQALVDKAAQGAGFDTTNRYFRGDSVAWNEIRDGVYVTKNSRMASRFGGVTRSFYVRENLNTVDGSAIKEDDRIIGAGGSSYLTSNGRFPLAMEDTLLDMVDSGVQAIAGVVDGFGVNERELLVIDVGAIKLAEPFTGVPLQERFNPMSNNIRFSMSEEPSIESRIRNIVPGGLNLVEDTTLAAAFAAKGDTLSYNPELVMRSIDDALPEVQDQILSTMVTHEVAHVAANAVMTPTDYDAVAEELGQDILDNVADEYYRAAYPDIVERKRKIEEDRESGVLTNRVLAAEWFRSKVEKAVNGKSTEEVFNELSSNQSLIGTFLKYLQEFLSFLSRRQTESFSLGTAASISRATRVYNEIANGGIPVVEPEAQEVVGHSAEFLEALRTGNGNQAFYTLPIAFADRANTTAATLWGRITKLVRNLPPDVHRIVREREGDLRKARVVMERFAPHYKRMLEVALKNGADINDVGMILGSTAPTMDEAALGRVRTATAAFRKTLAKGTPDLEAIVEAEKNRLFAAEKKIQDSAFLRRQKNAVARMDAVAPEFSKFLQDFRKKMDVHQINIGYGDSAGIYLTRTYKFFNTEGWASAARDASGQTYRVNGEDIDFGVLRDRAAKSYEADVIAEFASKNKPLTPQILQKEIYKKLDAFLDWLHENATTEKGESLSQDLRRFMPKNNVDSAVRELIGETTNPMENALRTYHYVAVLDANKAALTEIRKSLIDTQLGSDTQKPGFVQIFGKGVSESRAPLAGLYVREDIAKELEAEFGANARKLLRHTEDLLGKVSVGLSKMSGAAMTAKTLLSVGFYTRNILSNQFMLIAAQGIIPIISPNMKLLQSYNLSVLANFESKGKNASDEDIAEMEKLVRLGILRDSSNRGQFEDLIRGFADRAGTTVESALDDIMKLAARGDLNGLRGFVERAKGGVQYTAEVLAAVNSLFDDASKAQVYYVERSWLEKAYPNETEEWLDTQAATKTKLVMPGHSQQLDIVRSFNRSPLSMLVFPFARWKTEVLRTWVNTWKLGTREIVSMNPHMVTRGITRMSGMAVVTGFGIKFASMALHSAFRLLTGDDEEEDPTVVDDPATVAAFRVALPEYQKGHSVRLTTNGRELSVIDMTSIHPYATLVDAYNIIVEGNASGKGFDAKKLGSYFASQFIGSQIAAGAAMDAINNQNDFGQKIYEETDDGTAIVGKILVHLGRTAYEPGVVSKIRASTRKGEANPDYIWAGEFLGARPKVYTLDQVARSGFYSIKATSDSIKRQRSPLSSGRAIEEDKIREIMTETQEDEDLNQARAHSFIKALQSIGTDERIIAQRAASTGMSKKRVAEAFLGMNTTWVPSSSWAETMAENVRLTGEDDAVTRYEIMRRIYESMPPETDVSNLR